MFHASLLRPYRDPNEVFPARRRDTPLPQLVDGEEEWEVEAILSHRDKRTGRQYLIRWKGFGPEEDTWEPEAHIVHSGDLLRAYLSTHHSSLSDSA